MEKRPKYSLIIALHLLFISQIIITNSLCAQKKLNNNWIFGYWYTTDPNKAQLAELRFNDTGIIEIIKQDNKPIHIRSDIACISDKNGDLKIWSNNCSVFNSNYDTLIGDSQLKENRNRNYCDNNGGWPFNNSVIILPWPGSDDLYHMFYTDDSGSIFADEKYGLFFSYLYGAVIDFRNNSLGEITEVRKLLYNDTITVSNLTACRHSNGKDWWICTPMDAKPCYALHTLSDSGYSFHHKQCIGTESFGLDDAFGQACFSPNGKYYARYSGTKGIHFFKFNNSTGILSDQLIIPEAIQPPYSLEGGICFSPNSRFLYQLQEGKYVFQYDVTESNIIASRVLIDTLDLTKSGQERITNFQHAALGPDGRIYISGNGSNTYLNVINRPNCKGKDCELVQQAIKIPVLDEGGVPNVPHFIDWKEVYPDCIISNVKYLPEFLQGVSISIKNHIVQIKINNEDLDSQFALLTIEGKILEMDKMNNNVKSIELNNYLSGIFLLRISKNGFQKTFKINNY
ncbi:MAG: hypothetical protein ABI851_05770 [Saprospiraceae bacterium]